MSHSNNINEYVKSSQHICMSSAVSIILILLFIISPINQFFLTSLFGKMVILILLAFTLCYM